MVTETLNRPETTTETKLCTRWMCIHQHAGKCSREGDCQYTRQDVDPTFAGGN